MKKTILFSDHSSTVRKSLSRVIIKLILSRILLVTCILFLVFQVSAQEVKELNGSLSGNNAETNKLRSLVNDLQPTLYFQQNEQVGNNVEAPLLIDSDAASVDQFYVKNPEYNSVELIRIRINSPEQMNLFLDISKLDSFINLKYIYFLCAFDLCEEQSAKSACEIWKISKMINQGTNTGIRFYYLISIPS